MKKDSTEVFGLDDFISRVAAAEPLPGGGSVAALAGVLAVALGEMMAGLTEGRKKFASVESRVRELHARLTDLGNLFRDLVEEDPLAYKSLLQAIRLPRNTKEEEEAREKAIERSTRAATETPLRTARAAVEVLECLAILLELGNPHARSDVAMGAQLAFASLKGSQYNALVNIAGSKDASFAESCRTEAYELVRRGQKALQLVERRLITH